ncbi:MAG: NAD(P)-dependent oxidoreductase [Candidatus Peribacteraceae bacterium]
MPPIVFLEVDKEDEARIREQYPDALILFGPSTENGVLAQCSEAEIISCFIYSKFGAKELAALPKLRLLCTRSVGFDHIDLATCAQRNITVCNVPDYGSHVIAEHVFALLLGTLRHIHEGDKRVEGGAFDYRGLRGKTLRGKTISIVGTGKIGCRVAQIAHGFGMKILAVDRCRNIELEELLHVRYVEMAEALRQSDILSLHLPLLDTTKHIIDAKAFAQMKDGAILINTARGGLVESKALVNALKSGKVSYALLDVMENEKDFEENRELIAHPNAITTPHIAFYADDSMFNMYSDCFDSIEQWKEGKTPEHIIKQPKIVCDLPELKRQ